MQFLVSVVAVRLHSPLDVVNNNNTKPKKIITQLTQLWLYILIRARRTLHAKHQARRTTGKRRNTVIYCFCFCCSSTRNKLNFLVVFHLKAVSCHTHPTPSWLYQRSLPPQLSQVLVNLFVMTFVARLCQELASGICICLQPYESLSFQFALLLLLLVNLFCISSHSAHASLCVFLVFVEFQLKVGQ